MQKRLGLKNMPDLVKKEIRGIFETKNPTDDSKYKYAHSDLMENIIKNCRRVKNCNDGIIRMKKEEQRENFRSLLGFKEHDIKKVIEKTTLESVIDTSEREHIQTQYKVLGYEIDLYFHDYKFPVEIDEKYHQDINISFEIERQKIRERT